MPIIIIIKKEIIIVITITTMIIIFLFVLRDIFPVVARSAPQNKLISDCRSKSLSQ